MEFPPLEKLTPANSFSQKSNMVTQTYYPTRFLEMMTIITTKCCGQCTEKYEKMSCEEKDKCGYGRGFFVMVRYGLRRQLDPVMVRQLDPKFLTKEQKEAAIRVIHEKLTQFE